MICTEKELIHPRTPAGCSFYPFKNLLWQKMWKEYGFRKNVLARCVQSFFEYNWNLMSFLSETVITKLLLLLLYNI